MRFIARIVVAVVAVAMLGLVGGGTSPAGAAQHQQRFAAHTVASHHPVGDQAAKKKSRKITINFKSAGRTFSLTGQVGPKKKSKRIGVALYRSQTRGGHYTKFKGGRTNGQAKYGFYRLGRAGFYKVGTPGTKKFRPSASKVIHVIYQ